VKLFLKDPCGKKQLTTTQGVVGETVLNRAYIFPPFINFSIFCAYFREPNFLSLPSEKFRIEDEILEV